MDITLETIAARLEGLEETIISKLVDRAQFSRDASAYEPGKSGFENEPVSSLFEVRLRHTEEMDSRFGRFLVPEERPFCAGLPGPQRAVHPENNFLKVKNIAGITLASEIRESYRALVGALCPSGDDGQYGSAVEHDIFALQAIARRIHFGALYVAEIKFRQEPAEYTSLVHGGNTNALMAKLTRKSVEDAIFDRVREKVAYLQGRINPLVRFRIDPEVVLQYYRDTVIPLTKKGEIMYLIKRANIT
jgi:chorismate mutase